MVISYGPCLLIGPICWTISSSLGIRKMSLSFVAFGNWSGCCSINVWWYLLGLNILIIRIIIVLFVSALNQDYCYSYHLSWRYYAIAFNYTGTERDFQKAYWQCHIYCQQSSSSVKVFLECLCCAFNFNRGIGNAYHHFLDMYYMVCSLHFLYWDLCVLVLQIRSLE